MSESKKREPVTLEEILDSTAKCEKFAEVILDEIKSDEEQLRHIGSNIIKSYQNGDCDAMLIALCGWSMDSLLEKYNERTDEPGIDDEEDDNEKPKLTCPECCEQTLRYAMIDIDGTNLEEGYTCSNCREEFIGVDNESVIETNPEITQRKQNTFCPKCECTDVRFDITDNSYRCECCNTSWSDNDYVLVEHPDDTTYFEEEQIGYPCFNSEDNGARYVPEYEYILQFGKEPAANSYFRPIQWPDSQQYFELEHENESAYALCEVIVADEKALEDFGGSAIWVPLCLINNEEQ